MFDELAVRPLKFPQSERRKNEIHRVAIADRSSDHLFHDVKRLV